MEICELQDAVSKKHAELLEVVDVHHELVKNAMLSTAAEIEALAQEALLNRSPFQLKMEQRTMQPCVSEPSFSEGEDNFEQKLPAKVGIGSKDIKTFLSTMSPISEDSVGIGHTLGGTARAADRKLAGIRGWLARYDRHLEYAASVVVGLHVILLLVELELEGANSALVLDMSDWPAAFENPWRYQLRVLDVVFDFYFLLDLSLRMFVQRCNFCRSSMNCFEACVTTASLADLVIIAHAGGLAHPADATVLHLIRAAASLRLIRFCKFVEGIHMLLKACTSFLPSLCWSMVLLTIFMLVGALTIGNLIQDYITNPHVNREDRIWLWEHYGTAQRSLYTIYEITFAGNWPVNVRPVLSGANRAFAFFFLAYVTIIVFAILRVITAVFLKDSLDAAQSDAEHQLKVQMRKRTLYTRKLDEMFKALDESGVITEARLNSLLHDPTVKAYFETLDLDVHEGTALFHILDNGDGEVTREEFIDGILRCKGPARAIDQLVMHAEMKQLESKIAQFISMLGSAKVAGQLSSNRGTSRTSSSNSPMTSFLRVFRFGSDSERASQS